MVECRAMNEPTTPSEDAAGREEPLGAVGRYLVYTLSIPERAIRSTVGLTAGAAREATSFLVPAAFQDSKTYEIVVRNSLKFLVEDIAGAKPKQGENEEPEEEAQDDYVARKAVGNFLDLAGLATLHVSPVWLLAIVSDVAYGSRTYVNELAQELQKKGIIDESSTIHHVDDVLDAVRRGSGEAASLFDTPPLSADELKKTLDSTRAALADPEYAKLLPATEIARQWEDMKSIANTEKLDLLDVSAGVTMHALKQLKTVSHGALTGIEVAGGLINRQIFSHYAGALKAVHEKGFFQTVSESYGPYVTAVFDNFASDRGTLTEEVVTGRLPARMWRGVKGFFSRKRAPE